MNLILTNKKIAVFLLIPILLIALGGCSKKEDQITTDIPLVNLVSPTFSSTPTSEPTQTPFVVTATPIPLSGPQNVFIFSMMDNGYAHLYAYSPFGFPLTRLTVDPWDDITPAISPDGTEIAFSSRRNGYWDLYLLNLISGETTRLTDTMDYEANPAWSPDGRWLVFETYRNGNLDLDILSVSNPIDRYLLTGETSSDFSPAWSPLGRQIAYISNQTGENEVWIADLDKIGDDRFSNVSQNDQAIETHPAWSPDGKSIAWVSAAYDSSLNGIYVWNSSSPSSPTWLGSGDWPIWSVDGSQIYSLLLTSNNSYLEGMNLSGDFSLPPLLFPGSIFGFDFGYAMFPNPLAASIQEANDQIATPAYEVQTNSSLAVPGNRSILVDLPGVQAPYPRLSDLLDESFNALRQRVIVETGWDALASLENAYVPLSVPLDPGFSEDWLYAGRAFSLNPILIEAGWACIVKEEIGQQTYWRVFMRTRAQDGSQGIPMNQAAWDIYARFSGTAIAYDQGGQMLANVPSGFWVDFTNLAKAYGWERLASFPNWTSYFNGTRFNEFVNTSGLNWKSAMLQIYPPEIFNTPTSVFLPSKTPTKTPWHYRTPSPTPTLTPRPTFTPHP